MKKIIVSTLLAVFMAVPSCFASNDSDQSAGELSALTVLASVAVPLCTCYLVTGTVVGAGHQIVKLVDASGEGLSDLTADGLEQLDKLDAALKDDKGKNANAPRVTVNKKEIPLIVRPDFVEMNEKVKMK